MTKQEQFFYDQAGYSYNPKTETEEQARERCAQHLAQAETFARVNGWHCIWEPDEDSSADGDFGSPKVREGCILYDAENEVLESLWSIADASQDYQRVIEAELALEHMQPEDFPDYVPAGDIPMLASA